MKKLLLLFSMWPFFLWGQYSIDFENGLPANTDQYPANRWNVTSDDPLNGAYSLKHSFDNTVSSTDCIGFYHDEIVTTAPVHWEFLISYPYNPSSSNNWSVFLMSEKSAGFMLPGSVNRALILGVNYTSSDDYVKLYLQDENGIETLLISSIDWSEHYQEGTWRFRVDYRPEGEIMINAGPEDSAMTMVGKVNLNSEDLPFSEFFGLMYSYTSSKDRLLSFDDLLIDATFTQDTLPALLDSVIFPTRRSVEFSFNEKVFAGKGFKISLSGGSYNNRLPDSVDITGNTVRAWFDLPLENDRLYAFSIENISDHKNNTTGIEGSFTFFIPSRYDLIFSEIMADPSPPVYLPESEYVELYNRCKYAVTLEGWTLTAGRRVFELGGKTVLSHDFHIICETQDGWLYPEGICNPVLSSSSLTNSGQILVLRNHLGEIVDAVAYTDNWYGDDYKSEGGWSLERIDNELLCGNIRNWRATESDDGGTPGRENSVAGRVEDNDPPYVEHVIYDTAGCFRLAFNEPVIIENQQNDAILYTPGVSQPEILAELTPLFKDTLVVGFPTDIHGSPLPVRFVKGLSDCSGNYALPADTFLLGQPVRPSFTDIIFTEVLYSPFPGCSEFVELFNRSGKILSLGELVFEVENKNPTGSSYGFISGQPVLFYPGEYLVLSTDPSVLPLYYDVPDKRTLFSMEGMPGLGNDGAGLRLKLRSGQIIDEMQYTPDDQYPLLADDHGISLERMTLDEESGITAPWHTASSLAGFATPGYRNSQFMDSPVSSSSFSIEKDVFTPDNNGIDDVAVFNYHFEKEGYVGSLRIFDPLGYIVRTVGMNEILGVDGFFTWDGRDDQNRLCSRGIYLVYFEAWHLSGSKKVFKEAVVLARP